MERLKTSSRSGETWICNAEENYKCSLVVVSWKLTTNFKSVIKKFSLILDRIKSLLYFGGKRFCNLSSCNSEDRVLSLTEVQKRQQYTAMSVLHMHTLQEVAKGDLTDICLPRHATRLDMQHPKNCFLKNFSGLFLLKFIQIWQAFLSPWILKIPLRGYPDQHIKNDNKTESQI